MLDEGHQPHPWMLVQDVQPLALRSPLTMTHCAMGAMLRMANPINSSTDRTITTLMQMQAREARANARVPRCGERKKSHPVHHAMGRKKPRTNPAVAKKNSLRELGSAGTNGSSTGYCGG